MARREVQADGTVRETAANHARAPLDIAALRTLAREAAERAGKAIAHEAELVRQGYEGDSWEELMERLSALAPDVPALAAAVEQLADALEAKAQPRAHLDADELAIIEQTRALVRERADLRASVDLLDEQGRRMKAERDEAKEAERWIRKQLDGVSTSLTKERDDARAEIERMKPVVEAARAAERHITEIEDSSPINSGALIDLRAALETLDMGAS